MTGQPLYAITNGEPTVSTSGMAVLFGVTREEFRAEFDRQKDVDPGAPFKVPTLWARHGRRRFREASAAIGQTGLQECLEYLASLL